MEASKSNRGLNGCFFTPRLLAFRPLLHPRPAALNQDDQNNDRQSSSNNSDNQFGAHANFPFLPQLFGQ
jgi:hypothetical protein